MSDKLSSITAASRGGREVDGEASDGEKEVPKGIIMAVSMLAATIYSVDVTIANVALPHMRGTFSATLDQISWVLTSYIVMSAVATPCTGWLSERFGRRNLFMVGIGGFTAFSMMCGLANNLEVEIIGRMLQGLFGAFVIPVSMAIILDVYPVEEHGRAMAIWGMGVLAGPVVGPTLGGYLTEWANWRWVFFINLPLGGLALIGTWLFLPDTPRGEGRRFDWTGFVALGLFVSALQIMFDRGEREDWFESTEIWIEASIAAVSLYVFIVHSMTTRSPFLSPRLFLDRNFVVGLLLFFIFGLVQLGPMVLLPPMLQDLRDWPVTTIGALLAPRGLGMILIMPVAGRLTDRIDPRLIICSGFIILTLGSLGMVGWNLEVGIWRLAWPGILHGVGSGLIWVPLFSLAFSTLNPVLRVEGTSLFQLVRGIGSAIGVSIVVAQLARMNSTIHAFMVERITPFNELLQFPQFTGIWEFGTVQELAIFNTELSRQAAMNAYINDFWLISAMSLIAIPFSMLLGKASPTEDVGPGASEEILGHI